MTNPDTLIIGDTHIPFVHRGYLDFCRDAARKYKVKRVCHVGDLLDQHSISFHDHDPDGLSPGDEHKASKKELRRWIRAFPSMQLCIGNHDELIRRKAIAHGLSSAYFKSFGEVYGAPKAWRWAFTWNYGNWQLKHGTGTSGHNAALKATMSNRISTGQGHIHTAAGVKYHASDRDILWALQTGCGINRKAYAYNYGRDFLDKPILGAGLVLNDGKLPIFLPMSL